MPSSSPIPIIIQTSQSAPTWSYFLPFLTGLAVIVAAVIAYRAARVQSEGTIASTRLQIASDAEARRRTEEVEDARRKTQDDRHGEAVRNQIIAFLRGAAASMIVAGKTPGPDDLSNEELLQSLHRLETRSYDLDVIAALDKAPVSALLQAVLANAAVVTHLKRFWLEKNPSHKRTRNTQKKCAVAIRRMTDAMSLLGHVGEYYRGAADTIEKEAEGDAASA